MASPTVACWAYAPYATGHPMDDWCDEDEALLDGAGLPIPGLSKNKDYNITLREGCTNG